MGAVMTDVLAVFAAVVAMNVVIAVGGWLMGDP